MLQRLVPISSLTLQPATMWHCSKFYLCLALQASIWIPAFNTRFAIRSSPTYAGSKACEPGQRCNANAHRDSNKLQQVSSVNQPVPSMTKAKWAWKVSAHAHELDHVVNGRKSTTEAAKMTRFTHSITLVACDTVLPTRLGCTRGGLIFERSVCRTYCA
jgi:hypothetical protein